MRRILLIFMCFILSLGCVFSITACENEGDSKNASSVEDVSSGETSVSESESDSESDSDSDSDSVSEEPPEDDKGGDLETKPQPPIVD